MVEHVVLFKIKSDASAEQVEEMFSALRGLKDEIPGIVDATVGRNFTDRGKGFNCGLVVRLKDRQSLEAYGPHPAHQRVVNEKIKPIIDDILAVDYEI